MKIIITESQYKLIEARSHANLNIKTPFYEGIYKFVEGKNPDNIFVSFRGKDELGKTINKKGTDIIKGIYTYPWRYVNGRLSSAINNMMKTNYFDFEDFEDTIGLQHLPPLSDFDGLFMYIFEVAGNGVITTSSTREELVEYAKKSYKINRLPIIKDYIMGEYNEDENIYNKNTLDVDNNWDYFGSELSGYDKTIYKTNLSTFYNLMFDVSKETKKPIGSIFRETGVNVIWDEGSNLIHHAEPNQAIIINPSTIVNYRAFDYSKDKSNWGGKYREPIDLNVKVSIKPLKLDNPKTLDDIIHNMDIDDFSKNDPKLKYYNIEKEGEKAKKLNVSYNNFNKQISFMAYVWNNIVDIYFEEPADNGDLFIKLKILYKLGYRTVIFSYIRPKYLAGVLLNKRGKKENVYDISPNILNNKHTRNFNIHFS